MDTLRGAGGHGHGGLSFTTGLSCAADGANACGATGAGASVSDGKGSPVICTGGAGEGTGDGGTERAPAGAARD